MSVSSGPRDSGEMEVLSIVTELNWGDTDTVLVHNVHQEHRKSSEAQEQVRASKSQICRWTISQSVIQRLQADLNRSKAG